MDSKSENIRSKKTTEFKCSGCGDIEPENFYSYLPSRCIKCKRKYSKERRTEVTKEKKLKDINELDPDGNIRDVLERLIVHDKVLYGLSIFEFIKDLESRLSDLELTIDNRFDKASLFINNNIKSIENNQSKINYLESLVEMQGEKIAELSSIIKNYQTTNQN